MDGKLVLIVSVEKLVQIAKKYNPESLRVASVLVNAGVIAGIIYPNIEVERQTTTNKYVEFSSEEQRMNFMMEHL
jgi:hypothetical protein